MTDEQRDLMLTPKRLDAVFYARTTVGQLEDELMRWKRECVIDWGAYEYISPANTPVCTPNGAIIDMMTGEPGVWMRTSDDYRARLVKVHNQQRFFVQFESEDTLLFELHELTDEQLERLRAHNPEVYQNVCIMRGVTLGAMRIAEQEIAETDEEVYGRALAEENEGIADAIRELEDDI